MAPYNTPQAIRPLEKTICDFAYSNGYDPISVFNDFLRYVIHGFSPGAPPLMEWKYTEPDPLYGKYTTKEWTRYLIECQPDIEPADAFVYRNEAFTLYSREELERLVGILHGKLFNGFRPGLFILWAYRMEWKELPTWEWNMLKADTHLSFLGISPVRIQTDHKRHIVTIYKKSE